MDAEEALKATEEWLKEQPDEVGEFIKNCIMDIRGNFVLANLVKVVAVFALKVRKLENLRAVEDQIVEDIMYTYNQPQVDHIQGMVIAALAAASERIPISDARVLVRKIADTIPDEMIEEAKHG